MAVMELAGKVTPQAAMREAKRQGYSVYLNDDGIECELPTGKCIDADPGNPENHRFYFFVERWEYNENEKEFWNAVWYELMISNDAIVDCDAPICRH